MLTEQYVSDMRLRRLSPVSISGFQYTASTWHHELEATKADVYAWLAEHDWAPATQRTAVARMHAAYQLAIELEQTDRNPFDKLRLADPMEHPPRVHPASTILELESRCRSREQLLWLRMHTYTGLRRSEAIGITVNDVEGRFITVRAEVAKTNKARRVPIHPQLRRVMGGGAMVISGRDGGPLSARGSQHRLEVLRGGLDVQLHDLRRTFVTTLRRAGADRDAIKAIIGHSRRQVWDLYSAVDDDDLYRAVLLLNY